MKHETKEEAVRRSEIFRATVQLEETETWKETEELINKDLAKKTAPGKKIAEEGVAKFNETLLNQYL